MTIESLQNIVVRYFSTIPTNVKNEEKLLKIEPIFDMKKFNKFYYVKPVMDILEVSFS